MTDGSYWFGVTVTLRCHFCAQENAQRIAVAHVRLDRREISHKVLSRLRQCQKCEARVTDAKDITLYILPGTPAHLKNKGFPVPEQALAANGAVTSPLDTLR